MYQIRIASRKLERQLARLPKRERQSVVEVVRQLANVPRPPGIKQLNGNVYRLRVGEYRVIYKVFDSEQVVLIGKVDRRRERTYHDWEGLFRE